MAFCLISNLGSFVTSNFFREFQAVDTQWVCHIAGLAGYFGSDFGTAATSIRVCSKGVRRKPVVFWGEPGRCNIAVARMKLKSVTPEEKNCSGIEDLELSTWNRRWFCRSRW